MNTSKPTNPKDAIGSDKIPVHLWPNTATLLGALGLQDGLLKYGRSNYRAIGVRASIYYDAARRHLDRWFEGEDTDPDSGLPHMAHALASLAIIVDAQAAGKLDDDRMYPGGYHTMLSELTPHVARLKAKYADRSPRHYTIADAAMAEHVAREDDARLVQESNAAAAKLVHPVAYPAIDGWVPHDKSGVPDGMYTEVTIEAVLRGGLRRTLPAEDWNWDILNKPSDIIFWRPVSPA